MSKASKGWSTGPTQKVDTEVARRAARQGDKTMRKAHTRDSLQALSKLGEFVDGRYRIVSQPPVVIPARELAATYGLAADEMETVIHHQFREYRATLQHDRRHLLERFEIIDMARKVVGVGSVGTRAFIVLLQGRDEQDPLFLQVKEATRSVLEDHLPKSRYRNPGERVVQGQRLMQAASDIYLGWTKGVQADRYYYWRQLRDMKASALVDTMTAAVLEFYAGSVRVDPRPGPRPLRRPGRDRRIPRRRRRVRPVHHQVLPALRRPERTRLSGTRHSHSRRESARRRGSMSHRGPLAYRPRPTKVSAFGSNASHHPRTPIAIGHPAARHTDLRTFAANASNGRRAWRGHQGRRGVGLPCAGT